MAARDYSSASVSARQALARNPRCLAACQIMAALAEIDGSPMALGWRQRIAEIEPTLTNKLMLAGAALDHQSPPFALTAQILEELPAAASNMVPFHIVSAARAIKLNRLADAEREIAVAAALEPANRLHQMNLAALRLQSTNQALAIEARVMLGRLRTDPMLGPVALRHLVVDHIRSDELAEALSCSTQLVADPRATLEDRLQHLSVLKQCQEPDLATSLRSLQQRSATNAAAIYGVTGWMICNRQATDALTWLQELSPNMRARQPVPVAMTDCYVAKDDWAGLERFLRDESWNSMDFLRLAYRSRAAERRNETLTAAAHWRASVREAGDRLWALDFLWQLTERWQRPQDKEDLLWRIAERFPSQRWALRELNRIYAASGNTRGHAKVSAAMLASYPTDVAAKNDLAATSLLLKTNLKRAHELAREVYEAGKTNAVFVSTYAYSLHVQGKTDEGLRLMQAISETSLREPIIAIYYAILLAAAGEREKAEPYFGVAEKGPMLPEERQLLAQARR